MWHILSDVIDTEFPGPLPGSRDGWTGKAPRARAPRRLTVSTSPALPTPLPVSYCATMQRIVEKTKKKTGYMRVVLRRLTKKGAKIVYFI